LGSIDETRGGPCGASAPAVLAPHGAVAHHVDAQRQMRSLRRDVDRARPPRD